MASVLENGVYRIQPLHSRDKCLVLGQPGLDGAPQVILGRNSLHPLQEELVCKHDPTIRIFHHFFKWLVTRGENHTFVVSSMTLRKGYIDDVVISDSPKFVH